MPDLDISGFKMPAKTSYVWTINMASLVQALERYSSENSNRRYWDDMINKLGGDCQHIAFLRKKDAKEFILAFVPQHLRGATLLKPGNHIVKVSIPTAADVNVMLANTPVLDETLDVFMFRLEMRHINQWIDRVLGISEMRYSYGSSDKIMSIDRTIDMKKVQKLARKEFMTSEKQYKEITEYNAKQTLPSGRRRGYRMISEVTLDPISHGMLQVNFLKEALKRKPAVVMSTVDSGSTLVHIYATSAKALIDKIIEVIGEVDVDHQVVCQFYTQMENATFDSVKPYPISKCSLDYAKAR